MIIIRLDMELPERCPRCPFYHGDYCNDAGVCILKAIQYHNERCTSEYDLESDCPLLDSIDTKLEALMNLLK